jgi:hypothetical protein
MPGFEGPFTLARINCFAVMTLVLDIMEAIAVHVTQSDCEGLPKDLMFLNGEDARKEHNLRERNVETGFIFIELVMAKVDIRCAEDKEGTWRKEMWELRGSGYLTGCDCEGLCRCEGGGFLVEGHLIGDVGFTASWRKRRKYFTL